MKIEDEILAHMDGCNIPFEKTTKTVLRRHSGTVTTEITIDEEDYVCCCLNGYLVLEGKFEDIRDDIVSFVDSSQYEEENMLESAKKYNSLRYYNFKDDIISDIKIMENGSGLMFVKRTKYLDQKMICFIPDLENIYINHYKEKFKCKGVVIGKTSLQFISDDTHIRDVIVTAKNFKDNLEIFSKPIDETTYEVSCKIKPAVY